MMCEESGRRVNVGLLRPFTALYKGTLLRLLSYDVARL
jgi:hypothetical protein